MTTGRWTKIMGMILLALGLLLTKSSFALSGPPPLTDLQIGAWSFDDPSWLSDMGDSPISFTNLDNPVDWDGHALQVDSPHPAWLQYYIVDDTSGATNLTFTQGTIEFWFLPDWNSGHGPGESGRLIDVGAYSTNSPSSWWSLYLSPGGTNLYFSSETNGVFTNYLSVPISWASNNWHMIALAYASSQSQLYIDGQLVTNGAGSRYQPSLAAFTNGFFIGSDVTGTQQMRGQMDNLATYNYPLDAGTIAFDYQQATNTDTGGDTNYGNPAPDYGTNLFLTVSSVVSNTIPLVLSNTPADDLLEIQGCTNLARPVWISLGFVNGSELTNWTAASVYAGNPGNLFLRIRNWQDTTGTGIPDWWWLEYFGQTTNVDAYTEDPADDGLTDLQKYQMGLNPTNYYAPNALAGFAGCLDATGTNFLLEWNTSAGPVTYTIQKGILNTNTGNYVYSQITVNTNTTYFKDMGAITNANSQNNIYDIEASYPSSGIVATDTFEVSTYTSYGSYGQPYGPALPFNVSAYADAVGSNVLLSWSAPPNGPTVTGYVIEHGVDNTNTYSYNFTPITAVSLSTTNYTVIGALTNGNWSQEYAVVAVYPGGGLSQPAASPIGAGGATNTNAPTGVFGYDDDTGTNFILAWNPVSGATGYIIYGVYYNDDGNNQQNIRLGAVGAGTTSFEVPSTPNYYIYGYDVVAVFAGGGQSQATLWESGLPVPAPSNLNAYLGPTTTNVLLNWSPAVGNVSGYLIQRSDYFGYEGSYYEIGQVSANVTSFTDTNEIYPGYEDVTEYEVQAIYPSNGLSAPVTAAITTNLPSPSPTVSIVNGTNVMLNWQLLPESVTHYVVIEGTYNPVTGTFSYATVATLSPTTTSYEDMGAITSQNSYNNVFEVEAEYSAGGDATSAPSNLYGYEPQPTNNYDNNVVVSAQLIRNQTGRWQLMFSGIPTNVETIALDWYEWDYFYDFGPLAAGNSAGYPLSSETDISVSSLTNGIYVIPDAMTTNEVGNTALGWVAMVQGVTTNGVYGTQSSAGYLGFDEPAWADGREQLKANLLFQLRDATLTQPNAQLVDNNVYWDPNWLSYTIPQDTNYAESSFLHQSMMFKGYNDLTPHYIKKDDLWPFTANFELHQSLYDTNYTGPSSFIWSNTVTSDPAPNILSISTPYWINQGLGNASAFGAGTNDGEFSQAPGNDLFGLAYGSPLVNYGEYVQTGLPDPAAFLSIAIGASTGITNVNCFYTLTAAPTLQLEDYYFALVNTPGSALPRGNTPTQVAPIPTYPGFANTNQTQIMITSVGTPTVVGGWAKFGIQNGSASKFAYLGQYYVTNALVVTNGVLTTNTTGVVSPYGDFFPNEAGQTALITMRDPDSSYAQGTGVVDVISLNVDANHDGTMDMTYQGPDFVSASKPYRFWVNDVNDAGDDGGDGIPGGNGSTPDGMFVSPEGNYSIQGSRNLVNFFPVYLNIGSLFQSNAFSAGISATDTNWQFVLSQADGALRFAYTDLMQTNYMNFLRDTNEVFDYLHDTSLNTISNANNGGTPVASYFLSQIAGNHGGIILVEAWTNTTQPLVLTIYHGTNQIAQTSLALSISGVEQMFRSKTIMLSPSSETVPDRLTDAQVPNEPDTTSMNFIFVHGYNVNPQQARGWDADIYKRLYWSGSHAKFYGVTWEAADSQVAGQVTINLQTNIVNAFKTAPLLSTFLNSLSGTNVVAAHSLGNMLVLSTLNDCSNRTINTYFMVDAAVAIEAIDESASSNPDMYPTAWTNYEGRLWASDWYALFPTTDYRSALTWRGRLTNLQNANVYNFYSSGEEVLRDYATDPPTNLLGIAVGQLVSLWKGDTGEYTWAWQEKLKGLMQFSSLLSSDHGGWSFNLSYYTNYEDGAPPTHMSASSAAALPNSELQTNAFFDFTSEYNGNGTFTADLALYGSSGSSYAQTNQNRILSDAIPCLTLPVGANLVPRLQPPESPFQMNFDMQANYENGWPLDRPARTVGAVAAGEWHHSDNRAVAYTFTYKLFNQLVTVGNLK